MAHASRAGDRTRPPGVGSSSMCLRGVSPADTVAGERSVGGRHGSAEDAGLLLPANPHRSKNR